MKILYERVGGGPATLEDFADKHNLTMVVSERSKDMYENPRGYRNANRYHATFEHIEVAEGSSLLSVSGGGSTPEEAIADYADRICGKRLIFGAYKATRRTIDAPNEFLK